MTHITVLGMVAGTLTTVSFLPQLFKVWRSKSASDLSFVMLLILNGGMLLWLIYGFLIQDIAVIITHLVSLVLASLILGFKIKYHYNRRQQRLYTEQIRTQRGREQRLARALHQPVIHQPVIQKEALNSVPHSVPPLYQAD